MIASFLLAWSVHRPPWFLRFHAFFCGTQKVSSPLCDILNFSLSLCRSHAWSVVSAVQKHDCQCLLTHQSQHRVDLFVSHRHQTCILSHCTMFSDLRRSCLTLSSIVLALVQWPAPGTHVVESFLNLSVGSHLVVDERGQLSFGALLKPVCSLLHFVDRQCARRLPQIFLNASSNACVFVMLMLEWLLNALSILSLACWKLMFPLAATLLLLSFVPSSSKPTHLLCCPHHH